MFNQQKSIFLDYQPDVNRNLAKSGLCSVDMRYLLRFFLVIVNPLTVFLFWNDIKICHLHMRCKVQICSSLY